MWKSLVFFVAVFAAGLVGLLLVSGDLNRWWKGTPPSGGPGPESAAVSTPEPQASPASRGSPERVASEKPAGDEKKTSPDEIKIPVYDVVKGRLEYTFRGRLDETQLRNLESLSEIKAVTLRDGVLEVPIYDEIARELPRGEHQARQFTLTFASADYRASFRGSPAGGPGRGEREREEVFLHGGKDRGMGKTDDGSEFRFEELVFTIDRTAEAENYFTIRSEKPVSVENAYLRLESPNGLEGKIFKNKGLQKLEFFPPVRCYLDPRAGRLFSLDAPAPAPGGAPPAEAAARKVAIACAGPMSFLLDTEPRTIRFQKDVSIFPLDVPIPESGRPPPAPSTTHFDCQLLTIEVDSTVSPPQPTRAVATWDKGRVRAHHQGRLMEGDRLVWTLPPRAAAGAAGGDQRGEAVLTGSPTITGAEGQLRTGEVVFKLDEDKVLLRKGVSGNFLASDGKGPRDAEGSAIRGGGPLRLPGAGSKGPPASASGGARAAEGGQAGTPSPQESLPRDWDFEAAEGELVFAPADPASAKGKKADDPAAERMLKRFIARSSPERELVIKSRDGAQYRLTGRTLDYDAKAGAVTIEGDEKTFPRLYYGGDQGAARSIQLLTEEGRVVLRREVMVEIQDLAALSNGEAPRPEDAVDPKDASPHAGGPVQVLADELDLRFDSAHQLLGIEARQEAPSGRPATLKSLAPGSNYLLSGRTMTWNHRGQVATVEGGGKESGGFASPRLDYEGGTLAADRIRFDRNAWRVFLENGVAIRSCAAARGAAAGAPPGEEVQAFDLRAGRAEVELNEGLRPLGDAACGWSRDLNRVKSIHAWAPPDGSIELETKTYRGRAQEATWGTSSQELHIFGEGRQEIGWMADGRESTLTARDIVYACARQSVTLNGEVKGELEIESPNGSAGAPRAGTPASPAPALAREAEAPAKGGPAKKAPPNGEMLLFNFQTGQVEAKVREQEGRLEVASLLARRNVLLWNDRYRLKLTGDELSFDKDRQQLRMFSEEGRFQTLTYAPPAAEPAPEKTSPPAAGQPARVDQIDAREIWLWYRTVPAAGNAAGVESVVVKFRDDVNATFYAADPGLPSSESSGVEQKKWVLRSEHLGLRLSPEAEVREKIVQRALAEGNVIFSTRDASGDYMAMAREALYEEAQRKLTLRGDRQNPARLISGTKQFSYPEIALYELGESRLKWKGWEDPRPVPEGFDELRRDPAPRR